MFDLDSTLTRLAAMEEQAAARYDAEQREADEDYEPDEEGAFWLSLEEIQDGWACGWRIQPDEATEWAIVAHGATPSAAAQALLRVMETTNAN